jgi:hypothetical protein
MFPTCTAFWENVPHSTVYTLTESNYVMNKEGNNNNGRSRVSRGNKIQKPRKVFAKSWAEEACLLRHNEKTSSEKKYLANESRVKLAWTMPNAAEILYKKNGLYCSRNFRTAIMKPHLKVPGINYKKAPAKPWVQEACLLCRDEGTSSKKKFFSRNFRAGFSWHL